MLRILLHLFLIGSYILRGDEDTSRLTQVKILHAIILWLEREGIGVVTLMSSFRRCKDWLSALLKAICENGGEHANACTKISSLANGYTIAKLLDEYNYFRYTLKKSLEEIRAMPL